MIRLDRLGLYLPLPEITWKDLAVGVRFVLSRLPSWGIRAGAVSDEWRREHEQESGKH